MDPAGNGVVALHFLNPQAGGFMQSGIYKITATQQDGWAKGVNGALTSDFMLSRPAIAFDPRGAALLATASSTDMTDVIVTMYTP